MKRRQGKIGNAVCHVYLLILTSIAVFPKSWGDYVQISCDNIYIPANFACDSIFYCYGKAGTDEYKSWFDYCLFILQYSICRMAVGRILQKRSDWNRGSSPYRWCK